MEGQKDCENFSQYSQSPGPLDYEVGLRCAFTVLLYKVNRLLQWKMKMECSESFQTLDVMMMMMMTIIVIIIAITTTTITQPNFFLI